LGFLDFRRLLAGNTDVQDDVGDNEDLADFMHGFVNGCLEENRALVWKQIFSIQDDEEARRFVELQAEQGFFDGADVAEANAVPGNIGDARAFISNVFGHTGFQENEEQHTGSQTEPAAFTPFSGTGHHLGDEERPCGELALIIAENVVTMRDLRAHNALVDRERHDERDDESSSYERRKKRARRREKQHLEEARKGHSYSIGLSAGLKRKSEVQIRSNKANKSARIHLALEQ